MKGQPMFEQALDAKWTPASVAPPARELRRFTGWRDLVLTPLVEATILASAVALTVAFERAVAPWYSLSWIERIATVYLLQLATSVIALRAVWAMAPLREGIHGPQSTTRYIFNLTGFIFTLNLHGFCAELVPCVFRQLVCRVLGARIGKGMVVIAGKIADPCLTQVGDSAIIGDGALVLAHAIGVASESADYVMLARVSIGAGAVIGARSIILPGVTVGDHAMVQPLSLVPSNTKIPPGEIWGGIPAKKVGEIQRTTNFSNSERGQRGPR